MSSFHLRRTSPFAGGGAYTDHREHVASTLARVNAALAKNRFQLAGLEGGVPDIDGLSSAFAGMAQGMAKGVSVTSRVLGKAAVAGAKVAGKAAVRVTKATAKGAALVAKKTGHAAMTLAHHTGKSMMHVAKSTGKVAAKAATKAAAASKHLASTASKHVAAAKVAAGAAAAGASAKLAQSRVAKATVHHAKNAAVVTRNGLHATAKSLRDAHAHVKTSIAEESRRFDREMVDHHANQLKKLNASLAKHDGNVGRLKQAHEQEEAHHDHSVATVKLVHATHPAPGEHRAHSKAIAKKKHEKHHKKHHDHDHETARAHGHGRHHGIRAGYSESPLDDVEIGAEQYGILGVDLDDLYGSDLDVTDQSPIEQAPHDELYHHDGYMESPELLREREATAAHDYSNTHSAHPLVVPTPAPADHTCGAFEPYDDPSGMLVSVTHHPHGLQSTFLLFRHDLSPVSRARDGTAIGAVLGHYDALERTLLFTMHEHDRRIEDVADALKSPLHAVCGMHQYEDEFAYHAPDDARIAFEYALVNHVIDEYAEEGEDESLVENQYGSFLPNYDEQRRHAAHPFWAHD